MGPEEAGARLDQFLAAHEPALTRSRIKKLIDDGHVQVGGASVKAGHKLKRGEVVALVTPDAAPLEALPEDIPLTVLYEDAHLVVVDKPPGLVVHPAPGHAGGTLVNALLFRTADLAGVGGVLRPGIVHRLDKDTSGVMVVTKTDEAHLALSALFKAHTLDRRYKTIVLGGPKAASGTIDTLYGRHPVDRKRFSSKVARGKRAVTHWRVLERLQGATLLECKLETGRTHQIRVHMSDAGWPVLGDQVYGRVPGKEQVVLREVSTELGRQALHAATLELRHPVTGVAMAWRSEPPTDFMRALARLRLGK